MLSRAPALPLIRTAMGSIVIAVTLYPGGWRWEGAAVIRTTCLLVVAVLASICIPTVGTSRLDCGYVFEKLEGSIGMPLWTRVTGRLLTSNLSAATRPGSSTNALRFGLPLLSVSHVAGPVKRVTHGELVHVTSAFVRCHPQATR